jgi:hypothetical protein
MSTSNSATSLKRAVLMKVARPPVPGDLPSQEPGETHETAEKAMGRPNQSAPQIFGVG